MDTLRAVRALFEDWGPEDVSVRPGCDGAVLVALGLDLVGTSPANGGNAASGILNALASHRGLSVATEDGDSPAWEHLLAGHDVVVTPVRGWVWVVTDALPGHVTAAELAAATGLSRNTVREQLRLWVQSGALSPLPGFGEHGALAYPLAVVRELAAGMPGSGNRTAGAVRSEAARRGHAARRVPRLGDPLA